MSTGIPSVQAKGAKRYHETSHQVNLSRSMAYVASPSLVSDRSGLIGVLARMLDASIRQGKTRSAALSRDTVHIRGVWGFDMGKRHSRRYDRSADGQGSAADTETP